MGDTRSLDYSSHVLDNLAPLFFMLGLEPEAVL